MFPPYLSEVRRAIEISHEDWHGTLPIPIPIIRVHMEQHGLASKHSRAIIDRIARYELPRAKEIERLVSSVIRREGTRLLGERMLYDVQNSNGKDPNPENYMAALEQLCATRTFFDSEIISIDKAPLTYHEIMSGRRVRTGIQRLDETMGGGIGPGELGIVVAPPGGGKTAILVSFGAQAVRDGKNILHISLEIHKYAILERYDMNFTGMHWKELCTNAEAVLRGRKKALSNGGKLDIVDLSGVSVGVGTLKEIIRKANRRRQVDLVIVDYPACMERSKEKEQRFGELGNICKHIRMAFSNLKVAGWGAAQANREAILRIDDWGKAQIAEDITIMQVCDFLLCFRQREIDKQLKRGNLKLEKTRRDTGNPKIDVIMDFSRMTMEDANAATVSNKNEEKTRTKTPLRARQKRFTIY